MMRRRWGRTYHWVGRTFGWSTLVYLVFWIALFVVGGVQSAAPIARPVPLRWLPVTLDAVAWLVLLSVVGQRTPPVLVGRPHALLLGLSPQPARRSLRPRLLTFLSSRVLVGAVVGTAAWLLVRILFGVSLPLLAGVGASLWLLRAALTVLVYQRSRAAWPLLALAAGAAAFGALSGVLGLEQGAAAAAWATLVGGALGAVAAAAAWEAAGLSFPAGYLHDAMVVSEMRAAIVFAVMTQNVTGLRRGRAPLTRRRRAHKGRREGTARLRLPPPPLAWGALGVVAWRSSLMLLRTSWLTKVTLLVALAYVYVTLSAGVAGGLPLAVLGLAAGFLASWLVGPSLEPVPAPLDPLARGVGRTLPGLAVATAVFMVLAATRVALGLDPATAGDAMVLAVGLVALTATTLEKASSWLHLSHRDATTWALAGLVAGTLLWVLSGLGGPGTTGLAALAVAWVALFLLP